MYFSNVCLWNYKETPLFNHKNPNQIRTFDYEGAFFRNQNKLADELAAIEAIYLHYRPKRVYTRVSRKSPDEILKESCRTFICTMLPNIEALVLKNFQLGDPAPLKPLFDSEFKKISNN